MKINNYRGDLTDISAKKEALVRVGVVTAELHGCMDQKTPKPWKALMTTIYNDRKPSMSHSSMAGWIRIVYPRPQYD